MPKPTRSMKTVRKMTRMDGFFMEDPGMSAIRSRDCGSKS
jgi:hypothetical protein